MSRRWAYTIPLFSASLLAQQNQLTPQQQAAAQQMAGLEITFRNPPAFMGRLTFDPAGTGTLDGYKLIRYSIRAHGISRSGPFFLMTWDIGTRAPIIAMSGLTLEADGSLQCDAKKGCEGSAPGANVVVGVAGAIGQPRRFILAGKDKQPLAMGEVIPFPASGSDGNCSAEAVLISPGGEMVLLIGSGFEPGESVHLDSSCWGETVSSVRNADNSGIYQTMVLPFVKGHDEGDTQVTLNGSKCHPHTQFHWGSYDQVKADAAPVPHTESTVPPKP